MGSGDGCAGREAGRVMAGRIYVATESGSTEIDGAQYQFVNGVRLQYFTLVEDDVTFDVQPDALKPTAKRGG
jgi:hypothetical protein